MLVFLSSWVPLKFEAMAYFLLSYPSFLDGLLSLVGGNGSRLAQAAEWINPAVHEWFLLEDPWRDISAYFLSLCLVLLASCVMMNRKEVSYAK
jgi:hypothetical protein